jgi:acetyltransferase-like isoleucine patch superfamily enzyme
VIEIATTARVSPFSDIEDSVKNTRIVIGPDVVIDAFVKIKPAGGMGDVIIGKGSILNSGCVLYTGNGIQLGEHVAVAANCTFAPVNHEFSNRNVLIAHQGFRLSKGGITVGDDVWIGANCVILDGAEIGSGCVIGAGSVVRSKLEPYCVYAGNPLRKINERR